MIDNQSRRYYEEDEMYKIIDEFNFYQARHLFYYQILNINNSTHTMNKQKTVNPNPKQQSSTSAQQQISPALKVFSKTRDIDSSSPYHLDGDIEMYSEQKLKHRQQLANDPDLRRQIQLIVKMYELSPQGRILEDQYKRMQRRMAVALRPDIEEEELNFVVDQDWKLDSKNGSIMPQEMVAKIFELIDVWTLGTDKIEYITFTKLLYKKIMKRK